MEQKLIEQLKANNWSIAFENIDQVSEEQYAQIRMQGAGASDSSKLLNVNPFPNGTFDDLVKEKVLGIVDESIGKKASVRMGKEIEPLILEKAEKCPYLKAIKVYKPCNMYKDDNPTFLTVNFDGVAELEEEILLLPVEAKAVTKYGRKYYDFNKSTFYTKDGEWKEPRILIPPKININEPLYYEQLAKEYGIPVYYFTQIQQQMISLGSSYGYLAALDVDNWDMHLFKIYKDEHTQEEIIKMGTLCGIEVQIKSSKV